MLAAEMRDGARLCRLLETISSRFSVKSLTLSGPVRLPAGSRLQKIHNVSMALAALGASGATGWGDAAAQHAATRRVVEGDIHTVLKVIWALVEDIVIPELAPPARLRKEIRRVEHKHAAQPPHDAFAMRSSAQLLRRWAAAVSSSRNVTSSSSTDGASLLAIIAYYAPMLLPVTPDGAKEPAADDLFALATTSLGCIPNLIGSTGGGRVTVLTLAHLFCRLMEISEHAAAATALQRAWRVRGAGPTVVSLRPELAAVEASPRVPSAAVLAAREELRKAADEEAVLLRQLEEASAAVGARNETSGHTLAPHEAPAENHHITDVAITRGKANDEVLGAPTDQAINEMPTQSDQPDESQSSNLQGPSFDEVTSSACNSKELEDIPSEAARQDEIAASVSLIEAEAQKSAEAELARLREVAEAEAEERAAEARRAAYLEAAEAETRRREAESAAATAALKHAQAAAAAAAADARKQAEAEAEARAAKVHAEALRQAAQRAAEAVAMRERAAAEAVQARAAEAAERAAREAAEEAVRSATAEREAVERDLAVARGEAETLRRDAESAHEAREQAATAWAEAARAAEQARREAANASAAESAARVATEELGRVRAQLESAATLAHSDVAPRHRVTSSPVTPACGDDVRSVPSSAPERGAYWRVAGPREVSLMASIELAEELHARLGWAADEHHAQKSALAAARREAEERAMALEAALEALRSEHTAALHSLEVEREVMSAARAQTEAEFAEFMAQTTHTRAQSEIQIRSLREQVCLAETAAAEARRTLEAEVASALAAVSERESWLKERAASEAALVAQVAQAQTELTCAREEALLLQGAQAEAQRLSIEVNAHACELAHVEEDIDRLLQVVSARDSALAAAVAAAAEASTKAADAAAESLAALQAAAAREAELDEVAASLRLALEAEERSRQSAMEEIATRETTQGELRAQLAEAATTARIQVSIANEAAEKAAERESELQRELEIARAEAFASRSQLQGLEAVLDEERATRSTVDEARSRVQAETTATASLRFEVEHLEAALRDETNLRSIAEETAGEKIKELEIAMEEARRLKRIAEDEADLKASSRARIDELQVALEAERNARRATEEEAGEELSLARATIDELTAALAHEKGERLSTERAVMKENAFICSHADELESLIADAKASARAELERLNTALEEERSLRHDAGLAAEKAIASARAEVERLHTVLEKERDARCAAELSTQTARAQLEQLAAALKDEKGLRMVAEQAADEEKEANRARIDELELDLEASRNMLRCADERVVMAEQLVVSIRAEVESAAEKAAAAGLEAESAHAEAEAAVQEAAAVAAREVTVARAKVDTAAEEVKVAQIELALLREEIAQVDENLDEEEGMRCTAQPRVGQLESDAFQLELAREQLLASEMEIHALNSKVQELQVAFENERRERLAAQAQLAESDLKISAFREESESRRRDLVSAQTDAGAQHMTNIDGCKSEVNVLMEALAHETILRAAAHAEIVQLIDQEIGMRAAVDDESVNAAVRDATRRKEEAEADAANAIADLRQTQRMLEDEMSALDAAVAAEVATRNALDAAEEAHDSIVAELAIERAARRQAESAMNESSNFLQQAQASLRAAQAQAAAEASNVETLMAELEVLRSMVFDEIRAKQAARARARVATETGMLTAKREGRSHAPVLETKVTACAKQGSSAPRELVGVTRYEAAANGGSVDEVVGDTSHRMQDALRCALEDLQDEADARAAAETAVAQVHATAMADARAQAEVITQLAVSAAESEGGRLEAEAALESAKVELDTRTRELDVARSQLSAYRQDLESCMCELEIAKEDLASSKREKEVAAHEASACENADLESTATAAAVASAVHAAVTHTQEVAFSNQCNIVEEAMAHARETALREAQERSAIEVSAMREEVESLRSNLIAEIEAHAAARKELRFTRNALYVVELNARSRIPTSESLAKEEVELVAEMAAEAATSGVARERNSLGESSRSSQSAAGMEAMIKEHDALLRSVEACIHANAREADATRERTNAHAAVIDAVRARLEAVELAVSHPITASCSGNVASLPSSRDEISNLLIRDTLAALSTQQSKLWTEVHALSTSVVRLEGRTNAAQAVLATDAPRDISKRLSLVHRYLEDQRICLAALCARASELSSALSAGGSVQDLLDDDNSSIAEHFSTAVDAQAPWWTLCPLGASQVEQEVRDSEPAASSLSDVPSNNILVE